MGVFSEASAMTVSMIGVSSLKTLRLNSPSRTSMRYGFGVSFTSARFTKPVDPLGRIGR